MLLPPFGCGGDKDQAPDIAALRQEVAEIKQMQAQMAKSLATLESAASASRAPAPTLAKQPGAAEREVIHRIPITYAPRKGNEVAPVTVVEFIDFQCPFCQQAAGLPDQLLAEFPNQVQVAFKHAPLGRHLQAAGAAKAAWAAHQQGKFWEMHDLIFAGDIKMLSTEDLRGYAQQLGLDMARFDADMKSPKAQQAVGFDKQLGKTIKIWGTPSYFVNGRRVTDRTPAGIRAMIAEELAKSKTATPAAAPAS